jgi:hypothetical protein
MKHLPLLLAAALLLATSALADSPDAILKDYRTRFAQAVERLNQSLEKVVTPVISKLVASGDTAGAELLTSQLKTKLAGEPVELPQASAAYLFTLYDEARAKALAPVQKSSITRIESLLKTAGGPKLETITELGKVRAEIAAGRISSHTFNFPLVWTYHYSQNSPIIAELTLSPDGKWKLKDTHSDRVAEFGEWIQVNRNTIELNWQGAIWKVTFDKKTGVIDRPDVGMRYLQLPAKL